MSDQPQLHAPTPVADKLRWKVLRQADVVQLRNLTAALETSYVKLCLRQKL